MPANGPLTADQRIMRSGALLGAAIGAGQGKPGAQDWLAQFRQRFRQNHPLGSPNAPASGSTVLGG